MLLALVSVATAWVRQTVRSGTVILGLGAFFSSAAWFWSRRLRCTQRS